LIVKIITSGGNFVPKLDEIVFRAYEYGETL
jgi:hypothetical protein